ncbi:MAG: hypothetical protein IT254_00745 [Chitinophagaceae bacterium]|nr:hypothetical protein [Bacteroidota bacterium]MCC6256826.1 hypothetical protein [Chitinophagaceae bacterium]MCW5916019.1 hypothetical protein [Ferruginibacter sp.]
MPGNDGYYFLSRANNRLFRYEYLADRFAGYRIEHTWYIRPTWARIS